MFGPKTYNWNDKHDDWPLNAVNPGSLNHVEANHRVVVHNDRVIRLNKPHPTHVCSKIENMINPFSNLQAVIHDPEINKMEFITEHVLSHVLIFLPVRSNNVMPLRLEAPSYVWCNKTPSPSDGNLKLLCWPVRLSLKTLISVLTIVSFSSTSHSAHNMDLEGKMKWLEELSPKHQQALYKQKQFMWSMGNVRTKEEEKCNWRNFLFLRNNKPGWKTQRRVGGKERHTTHASTWRVLECD